MNMEQELIALREQVALLTQRVWALEQNSKPQQKLSGEGVHPAQTLKLSGAGEVQTPQVISKERPIAAATMGGVAQSDHGLESRIGSQWLNRVGIIAVLVGVSYFLKLAFENNWIGPATRVLIGLVAGVAVVWWSERFRTRGFAAFSYSLKAVGIGVMYLSLWAASQAYALVPNGVAFAGMVLVTAATGYMAVRQSAELIAGLAVLGGFLTPVLLSTGENREAALFSYLAVLDLGALVLQRFRAWPRVLVGAFAGTLALYVAWSNSFGSSSSYGLTTFFISVFFLIFLAGPLVASAKDDAGGISKSVLAVLPVANTAMFFLQARGMMHGADADQRSSAYALGISLLCWAMGTALKRREQEGSLAEPVGAIVHYGLAVAWLTVAVGLRLEAHWITLGWITESAALFYAGVRKDRQTLRAFGAGVLVLAISRLLLVDTPSWHPAQVLFNERFGLYALTVVALGWMIWLRLRSPMDERTQRIVAVAVVALNLLALVALNLEVSDYYATRIHGVSSMQLPGEFYGAIQGLKIERDFSYSAVWMIYGVVLMVAGFWKRSALLRWMAMALIGATVTKVFLYDVSALDRVYRIASFIILGSVLLAISFAYQKKLLGSQ